MTAQHRNCPTPSLLRAESEPPVADIVFNPDACRSWEWSTRESDGKKDQEEDQEEEGEGNDSNEQLKRRIRQECHCRLVT
jgi:phosphoribosylaminoimidazole-succinocarboxamide synthase